MIDRPCPKCRPASNVCSILGGAIQYTPANRRTDWLARCAVLDRNAGWRWQSQIEGQTDEHL